MIPDYWDIIAIKSATVPVKFVSWNQAVEYCKWQSQMFSNVIPESQNPNYREIITSNSKTKLTFKVRLPTEKEWDNFVKKNPKLVGFRCLLETVLT
jgi:formylglycine-generating enzyme required for sulfatase activity